MEKINKLTRILLLYEKLKNGEQVNKSALAIELGVHERSIQRDIDDIRNYLAEQHVGESIIYNPLAKAYHSAAIEYRKISSAELVAITKILLESRAFTKFEISGIIQSVVNQAEQNEQVNIKKATQNELHHYKPLNHNKPLLELIMVINTAIRNQSLMQITYERMDGKETQRRIRPLSLVFSEFYFYVVAEIEHGKYDDPAFFRLDRLIKYSITNEHFRIPEYKRFEAGELRNRIQFMYAGELIRLKFEFYGDSLSAALDRFPNGIVLETRGNSWMIEAQVYGTGCVMWLLSQGPKVKVIEPLNVQEMIKEAIKSMAMRYL